MLEPAVICMRGDRGSTADDGRPVASPARSAFSICIRSMRSPSWIRSTMSMPVAADPREHGVFVVEERIVHEVDEDLRVAGVAAAGGDADACRACASRGRPRRACRAVAGVFVRPGAAALDDDVGHDAVERQAVVVPGARERGRSAYGSVAPARLELQRERPPPSMVTTACTSSASSPPSGAAARQELRIQAALPVHGGAGRGGGSDDRIVVAQQRSERSGRRRSPSSPAARRSPCAGRAMFPSFRR